MEEIVLTKDLLSMYGSWFMSAGCVGGLFVGLFLNNILDKFAEMIVRLIKKYENKKDKVDLKGGESI